MGFKCCVLEQEGHRLHELVDGDSGHRIQVDNLGAELVSIARRAKDGTWMGYLYRDGDVTPAKQGWQSHATVMGFYLHRIKGEKTSYEGDEIRGGNHGFLRHKRFADPEVILAEQGTLSYSLPTNQILPVEYPRKVSFKINYTLRRDTLEVAFIFHNEENERHAHVSFGLHPGFAVSFIERARIVLPRGTYRRHLAPNNFLSGETVEFESDGATMPIKPFELPGSFLLETIEADSYVARLLDYELKRQVELDLSEAPYFTIWSDLNPFICIEPCWGLPDHQDQRPFEKKLGIQAIPAQETLTRRVSIRLKMR
jgi:galactose mutarotase-like enzyme